MKSIPFAALAALACLAAAVLPAGANGSQEVPVEVRVVTFKGKILADRSIRTGTTTVQTSKRATCLGGKPPKEKRRIEGATALGALAQLSRKVGGLAPLSLSGAYDFGIGLCGVGSAVASGKQWWALKVNGKLSSSGGDSTVLKKGDRVLWYLDRDYDAALPGELRLSTTGDSRRSQMRVKVVSLDGVGERSVVTGAKIFAGRTEVGVTNRRGQATFRIPPSGRKSLSITARLAGFIPSNRLEVRNGF